MQIFPTYQDIEKEFLDMVHHLPQAQAQALQDAAQATRLPFPPRRVNLGLTSRCNYNCPFCFNHASQHFDYVQGHFMDKGRLLELFEVLEGVLELGFEVMGETLLYPDILQIMELAATKVKKLALTSNGALLTPGMSASLCALPFAEIFISCEAADKETYERLRQGGCFKTFCQNVSALCSKANFPIKFNAIVFANNLESLLGLPRLAAQLGIHSIQFVPPNETPQARKLGFVRPAPQDLSRFIEQIQDKCKEFGIGCGFIWSLLSPQVIHLVPGQDLHQSCPLPFDSLSLDPWGRSNSCCYLEWFEQGNVFTQPPATVWNSAPLRMLRAMNITGLFPQVCQNYCNRRPSFREDWSKLLDKHKYLWPGYWQETSWETFFAQHQNFVLWPGGKVTRALLKKNFFPSDRLPLAIIDRKATKIQTDFDLPVLTPQNFSDLPAQAVLITSETFTAEILQQIMEIGKGWTIFFLTGKKLLVWNGPQPERNTGHAG